MLSPSARALLGGVVDYAGLFPPAALSMADAVAEYAAAQRGADAWMLGRFVLPAAPAGRVRRGAGGAPPGARRLAPERHCSATVPTPTRDA